MSMQELWRDIEGEEGRYQVSNLGRVRSLCGYGGKGVRVMKLSLGTKGRPMVCVGRRTREVHVLVAKAFVPGYEPGLTVNHKDEDKLNNRADNLEWVRHLDNIRHGTGIERSMVNRRKAVLQISKDGEILRRFRSMKEAAMAVGGNSTGVWRCCKGVNMTHRGFRWSYAE